MTRRAEVSQTVLRVVRPGRGRGLQHLAPQGSIRTLCGIDADCWYRGTQTDWDTRPRCRRCETRDTVIVPDFGLDA